MKNDKPSAGAMKAAEKIISLAGVKSEIQGEISMRNQLLGDVTRTGLNARPRPGSIPNPSPYQSMDLWASDNPEEIAQIIDKETGVKELIEALEHLIDWAEGQYLPKEPFDVFQAKNALTRARAKEGTT